MSLTVMDWARSQLMKLPYPTKSFAGQTIIVTGSNVGMGLEAARHFARLDAAKVILAVRTISKGEAAKESIEVSEKRVGVIEVWELDLAKYASVKAFAEKAKTLDRLDVVVANAGIYVYEFEIAEDHEYTVTVNVISTMLLGILLLPKLRETSVKFDKETVLTVTSSFVHFLAKFPEQNAEDILEGLTEKKGARMNDRYTVSKLIQLLAIREFAKASSASSKAGRVIISAVNPGFVATQIMRNNTSFVFRIWYFFLCKTFSRTAEEGGRTLINGAEGGSETHGQYLSDCEISHVSKFVSSEKGHQVQVKLWNELSEELEKIQPGVMKIV